MKLSATVALAALLALPPIAWGSEDVIFKDKQGHTLTREDLRGLSGTVNWEIRSKDPVPSEAIRLHELGRASGQRGETKSAIEYFERAAKLAPGWPYPTYDEAFTHLLEKNYSKAYELYRAVDRMAPRGFFTTKTAVHTLKREAEGDLPQGTYLRYVSLEWVNDEVARKQIVISFTERLPSFAPAWKERAQFEESAKERFLYLQKGLAAKPDKETEGYLLLNKALVLHEMGRREEAIKMLGSLALDLSSPSDIQLLAKKSLANIVLK